MGYRGVSRDERKEKHEAFLLEKLRVEEALERLESRAKELVIQQKRAREAREAQEARELEEGIAYVKRSLGVVD